MSDDPENLRRVIRLIEEMDAYFGQAEFLGALKNIGARTEETARLRMLGRDQG